MGVKAYVVDIESTPLVVRTWSLWKPTNQSSNIIEDRKILCIGYKEVGSKRAQSISVGPDNRHYAAEMLRNKVSVYDIE